MSVLHWFADVVLGMYVWWMHVVVLYTFHIYMYIVWQSEVVPLWLRSHRGSSVSCQIVMHMFCCECMSLLVAV